MKIWSSFESRNDSRSHRSSHHHRAIDKEDSLQNRVRVIKKVWEVDPLEWPKCGKEMKIISFIDNRLLIRRILEHLDLWPPRL
jgi:hypothetical protein